MIFYDEPIMNKQNAGTQLLVDKANYHSFLLRIWKTKELNGVKWYLSLENPITHEINGFHDLQAFNNYLTQFFEKTQAVLDSTSKGDEK